MAEEWRIARTSRTCAHSGEHIDTAHPYYSALVEKGEAWERLDFTPAAWPEVDKAAFFSYWKNKGGVPAGGKRDKIDFERLLCFFDSLEGSEERRHRLFRYVLALVLGRKRHLRLDDMGRTPEGDRLIAYDKRTSRTLEIVSPEATREELAEVREELNRLFEMEADNG